MWHKQSVELKGEHSCDETGNLQTSTNCVVDIDTLYGTFQENRHHLNCLMK